MLDEYDINININILLENIPDEKIIVKINNYLINEFLKIKNENYILYTFENPIEWTPIKLYQYVYYFLRSKDEFWIIKYSKFDGLIYNYVGCIQDVLIRRKNNLINFSTRAPEYLIKMYINYLKNSKNGYYYYLSTVRDHNDNTYDNYIIKLNDKIDYVQLIY
jgi:hypothetical protein